MYILYNIAGFYRQAGMERAMALKANWFAAHGHRVTIVTTEQKGRAAAFPLDPRIELIDLAIGYEDNNGGSLWNKIVHYPGKQRRHRRALTALLMERRPDIAISMFCNEVNILPRIKDGSHKVLEVHFSRFKRLQYCRGGLWALVDKIRSRQDAALARRYDRFVVLTLQDKEFWGPMDNIRVIGNPVDFRPETPAPLDGKTVIAVGRYSLQKSLDRLVDAWNMIKDKDGWTLRLVGDGELRGELEEQIRRLSLEGSVVLGRCESDMESVYRSASILALSSRYEGQPMVLLECQTFGVPAVSFDCKCGPREIIDDGKTGFLVQEGDIPALAKALEKLMQDNALRKEMGLNAFRRAEQWRPENIMPQWIRLFEEIL